MKPTVIFKPFAKSVEDKPHTALGAASIDNIQEQDLPVPCSQIVMDEYFTGKTYPIKHDQPQTLHQLIKRIQEIIAEDYEQAFCNYHEITDLCIEVIDYYSDGTAKVYIGS